MVVMTGDQLDSGWMVLALYASRGTLSQTLVLAVRVTCWVDCIRG